MRVLVVGAGATGGYFGARLAEAGRDVTFLVRPARAERLAAHGLVVKSPVRDVHIPAPSTVTADRIDGPFDLVLLSCKAYDLDSAVAAVAPAVGPSTMVLPILNGMAHLDLLDARFGMERVLGGSCAIAATLSPAGEIVQMSEMHSLTFGERDGARSARVEAVAALMQGATFTARLSEKVLLEMWEKWVFLATLAGGTCLMRGAVCDIVAAPGGRALMQGLLDECRRIASDAGFPPREKFLETSRAALTAEGSTMTASMLRDIERGAAIEADHIIGDLIRRGRAAAPGAAFRHLDMAYAHLKTYEGRRARAGT
ncbi:2-dehydropantoate 2-reductase [Methylobacterium nodulans]|uniref:2-dehydropantoate 2-reductase n=1 Tax=Methylobacterium nodulans (strain LMG 21967 / CNCM I-2342 / ORS 2060) TaxID=460265 RepID=B8IEV5_METNO|nr:2-dehydropantoate 2-reductase [Methylobacterium nodulans]ACL61448.1 2-dehydropantoate 2-reductase [Methylobacterium nodulans ORS 2060]